MNRWETEFKSSVGYVGWKKISKMIEELEIDDVSDEEFMEFARLQKVSAYIDGVLESIDFDIVPKERFGQVSNHYTALETHLNSYKSTGSLNDIIKANNQMNSILNIVILMNGGHELKDKSIRNSNDEYRKSVEKIIIDFSEKSGKKIEEISEIFHKIKEFNSELFEPDGEFESIEGAIRELLSSSSDKNNKINDFYNDIFEGGANSIESQITQYKVEAEKEAESARKAAAAINSELEEIDSYYIKVMGEENEEGERSGGLKDELQRLLNNLNDFEKKQKIRYQALNYEIQSALPGATRAGLAKAYSDMRKTFDKPILLNSIFFYISLSVLVGLSLFFLIDKVEDKFVVVTFPTISDAFINILQKLPIIVPLVWVAVFSAKRRSEYLRLQQEYAHKEALSFSYQNFKEQIDKLNSESKEEMLDKLLVSAIYAVSSNASETLDKKHEESSPVHELFSQLLNGVWNKKSIKEKEIE